MAKKDKYLVGLDIGSTKTSVLIAEIEDEQVKFLALGAAESKDELMTDSRGIPYLVVRGRLGGSAMAAAAPTTIAPTPRAARSVPALRAARWYRSSA